MTSDIEVRERLLAEQARLGALRDGLQAGLSGESETESLGELSSVDQHPADTGTETFNRERDLGIIDSVDGELSDVETALQRLETGSYGVCEVCGRPIEPERLEALPATRFCVQDAGPTGTQPLPGIPGG